MTHFQFEADFVEALRCIPMQVRYKLDTCGVKLKLTHWHQLSLAERQQLVEQPCDSVKAAAAYRDYLQERVAAYTGAPASRLAIDPNPPWHRDEIPEAVTLKLQETEQQLAQQDWRALSPLQRFALIKLSRPGHENRNFVPALIEFTAGIYSGT